MFQTRCLAVAVAMPPPIAPWIREHIRHELELGYDNDQILAGGYGISRRTLQRMRKTWKEWDSVCIPFQAPQPGRDRIINDLLQEELLIYLDQRPMAYLDEMAWFLYDEFDVTVDEPTIWPYLHRLGWSRKNMRKIAQQRNQDLRNACFVRLAGWRAEQLIFLDESAACDRTGM